MSGEFCDTNVLVYAYDVSAGSKRDRAGDLVDELWDSGQGVVSVQVLQELFVALTRKVPRPLAIRDARPVIADLCEWRVIEPTAEDVLGAIDAADRWQISLWDAMIVASARKAGAETIWSEDLNHGQDYGGTVVRNPFR